MRKTLILALALGAAGCDVKSEVGIAVDSRPTSKRETRFGEEKVEAATVLDVFAVPDAHVVETYSEPELVFTPFGTNTFATQQVVKSRDKVIIGKRSVLLKCHDHGAVFMITRPLDDYISVAAKGDEVRVYYREEYRVRVTDGVESSERVRTGFDFLRLEK